MPPLNNDFESKVPQLFILDSRTFVVKSALSRLRAFWGALLAKSWWEGAQKHFKGPGVWCLIRGICLFWGLLSLYKKQLLSIIAQHFFLCIAIAITCQPVARMQIIAATADISPCSNFLLPEIVVWWIYSPNNHIFQVATTGGQVQLQYATSPSSQHG